VTAAANAATQRWKERRPKDIGPMKMLERIKIPVL
jgi:hypothetical protein